LRHSILSHSPVIPLRALFIVPRFIFLISGVVPITAAKSHPLFSVLLGPLESCWRNFGQFDAVSHPVHRAFGNCLKLVFFKGATLRFAFDSWRFFQSRLFKKRLLENLRRGFTLRMQPVLQGSYSRLAGGSLWNHGIAHVAPGLCQAVTPR